MNSTGYLCSCSYFFFAFPLGVTRTTALRKPIVRFTGPEGIKRLTGAVGFWYSNLDTREYF